MPGFIATCYDPKTKRTTTSECDDLPSAQIRARTLRGLVLPFENQKKCVAKVQCPDGDVWEWRTVVGRSFWQKADE